MAKKREITPNILTGYLPKDKTCDQHASTGGHEACCSCKNDDPNDKRMCDGARKMNKRNK
jgi:hypothetical protein